MTAPHDIAAIKTATKQVVGAVGGIDAAASATRVGRSQIADYYNRNSPQVVPADVAVALDQCAEHPHILAAMAHAEGYTILPIRIGEGDIAQNMQDIALGAGELMAETVRVLADGIVTEDERQALMARLQHLNHFVNHAMATLRGMSMQDGAHTVVPLKQGTR